MIGPFRDDDDDATDSGLGLRAGWVLGTSVLSLLSRVIVMATFGL